MVRAIWWPQVAPLGVCGDAQRGGGGGQSATLTCARQRGVTLVYTRHLRATLTRARRPRVTLSCARQQGVTLVYTRRPRATLSLDGRPRVTLTSGGRWAASRYAFATSLQHAFRSTLAACGTAVSIESCSRGGTPYCWLDRQGSGKG